MISVVDDKNLSLIHIWNESGNGLCLSEIEKENGLVLGIIEAMNGEAPRRGIRCEKME